MLRRKTKIICTIGWIQPGKELKKNINQYIKAGMDVARINMAHYDLTKKNHIAYLTGLINAIRRLAKKEEKTVAVMGDIQGPKVRIKRFLGRFRGKDKVLLDREKKGKFILTYANELPDKQGGARIKHEGEFNFFQQIRENVDKDDKNKPRQIEFWFGDGKVILQTTVKDIGKDSASCRVAVANELETGKGVSVKNSKIKPGAYQIAEYDKDKMDIDFLLKKEVDLLPYLLSIAKVMLTVCKIIYSLKLRI